MDPFHLACKIICLSYLTTLVSGSFYDFNIKNMDGNVIPLAKYRGKVTLIVNVASYCGYTQTHYDELVTMKRQLGEMFDVLAFPCNQFGAQEPEDVPTIVTNMKKKFDVNFEIYDKIDVIGENVPDFWKFLNDAAETEPRWNFFKYLVGSDGQVWGAWGPDHSAKSLVPHIAEAIKEASNPTQHATDEL